MTTLRCCTIVAGLLAAALLTDGLSGGCARVTRRVQVRGLVLDSSKLPVAGAEVYAVPASLAIDDDVLSRIKAQAKDEAEYVDPRFREHVVATTDAGGHYTLELRIGSCHAMGPIADMSRALLGSSMPTPHRYSVVAQAAGQGRSVLATTRGSWAAGSEGSRGPWIYEMPPSHLGER